MIHRAVAAVLAPPAVAGCATGPQARSAAAAPAAAVSAAGPLAGATLIDGTGGPPVADAVVLAAGARLARAGSAGECPGAADARRVDRRGRWLMPGTADAPEHRNERVVQATGSCIPSRLRRGTDPGSATAAHLSITATRGSP